MDPERTIADIEWLERISSLPDTRPLSASDIAAANRRHDEALSQQPVVSPLAVVRCVLPTCCPRTLLTRIR